jgi:hypothetical protein
MTTFYFEIENISPICLFCEAQIYDRALKELLLIFQAGQSPNRMETVEFWKNGCNFRGERDPIYLKPSKQNS